MQNEKQNKTNMDPQDKTNGQNPQNKKKDQAQNQPDPDREGTQALLHAFSPPSSVTVKVISPRSVSSVRVKR